MSVPPPATEEELHAFIDDELTEPRRREILVLLEDDPALAARIAGYRADHDRLRATFAGLAERPVPDAWTRRIEAATTSRPRQQAAFGRRHAIAAGIVLALGGTAALVREWPHGDTILADAGAARDGLVRGRTMAPDQLAAVRSRDDVLRAALGMPLRVPDLRRYGFQLTRIDLFGHAAQLGYTDERQRLLTIYVRRSNGDVRFDLLRQGSTRVCIWQDDVVGTVIMAPISAGEMMRVASSAYGDLNL